MKRNLKRVLALALSVMMFASLMLPQAMAAKSGKCKNLKWTYKNSTLTISGKGDMDSSFDMEAIVEAIGEDQHIKKVVVKEGVTSLCSRAFYDCEMSSISLPKSLKKFGRNALQGTNLKSVSVAKGSKYFSAKDGVLFNKKKTTLYYYPTRKKGSSYTVPSSVTTIAACAFDGEMDIVTHNPNLKKLTLPKKLKKVGESAFAYTDISTFKFKGANPKFAKRAFEGVESTIQYPKKHRKCWKGAIESLKKEYSASSEDEDEDVAGTDLKFKWF